VPGYYHQVRHVLDEKAMLVRLTRTSHPFLVSLRGSFQDTQCLYLAMGESCRAGAKKQAWHSTALCFLAWLTLPQLLKQ
jgi:hypothetical protein